jgi:plasmid maintenance system antidote protein VapI
MTVKTYPKLSAILKKLLFQEDIKSVELARALGIPAPTIHRLVTGKSTRPYKSSLDPIAKYFGITSDQLLGVQPLFPDETIGESGSNSAPKGFQTVELLKWESLDKALQLQCPTSPWSLFLKKVVL